MLRVEEHVNHLLLQDAIDIDLLIVLLEASSCLEALYHYLHILCHDLEERLLFCLRSPQYQDYHQNSIIRNEDALSLNGLESNV